MFDNSTRYCLLTDAIRALRAIDTADAGLSDDAAADVAATILSLSRELDGVETGEVDYDREPHPQEVGA